MDTNNNTSTATTPILKSPDELAAILPYYEESAAVDRALQKALALIEQFASSSESHGDNNEDDDNPWKNPDHIYQQLDQARNEISQAWEKLHAATRRESNPLLGPEKALPEKGNVATGNSNISTAKTTTKKKKAPMPDEDAQQQQQQQQEQIIRMAYMDMITDAFADVLEDIRQRQESGGLDTTNNKDDPIDVETLVDCLQSGLDLVTNNNKMLLLSSFSETDFEFGDTADEDATAAAVSEDNKSEDGDDVKLTPHESRRRQLGYLLVDQL